MGSRTEMWTQKSPPFSNNQGVAVQYPPHIPMSPQSSTQLMPCKLGNLRILSTRVLVFLFPD